MENNLLCFKRTSNLTALSLPKEFREGYYIKFGVWAKLVIVKGKMKFAYLDEDLVASREYTYNNKSELELIEPYSVFRIKPNSIDLQFHLEFYCEAKNYFFNKYELAPAHPEVVNATNYIEPCKTLDLGAGQGKNSLFLASLNYEVVAMDNNSRFLQELADISMKEKLDLTVLNQDINTANIKNNYDFICATDVFMYLNPTRISSVIRNMQKQTKNGGYNLIVSALNVKSYGNPTPPYPFTFMPDELKEYYEDWKIIKYHEYLTPTPNAPHPQVILLAKKEK